ncbi:MAG: CHAT domain-containing protein, partial [Acidobacteria bacterium]|nr:CHAT domain-containing protein [Acidobacteriota bacterium]
PVVTAPSAAAIAAMRKTRGARPERELAIFSDPRVPALARLPFAKTEAAHIVNLAGGRAVYSASGDGATRQAVLDHPARIMHFAAHSLLDTERPDRTEIALSGEPLRLRDVAGLRLDDSLIVLSACQTALGREMKREGLLGLAYAFQQAGASQVLASLWKVDDRATAELMKHFYEGLLRQGLRAPEALTAAQQTLARSARWPHPFYWAGFTIQGDWR